MKSRVGFAFLSLLLVLPLAIGAALSYWQDWRPADAWGAGAADRPAAGAGGAELVDARRATGQAQSQAGFLTMGTDQLVDGTGKLVEGAKPLGDGAGEAAAGAQKLYDALVQLQAGTGQLGSGATQVADGVGTAVDSIVGVNAVRGQIVVAIDGTLQDLAGNNSAEARQIRSQLTDLKAQAENFKLDQGLAAQLEQLKSGSRDVANQLAVSGYAYHDGIYQVTEGARQLNAGLKELDGGVDEALKGVGDLDKGANQLQSMAQQNADKVDAIAAELPGMPTAGAAGSATAGATAATNAADAPSPRLAPVLAALLAALAGLGGTALGWVWAARFRASQDAAAAASDATGPTGRTGRFGLVLGGSVFVSAAAAVGLGTLATTATWPVVGIGALAALLITFGAAAGTRVLLQVCGRPLGIGLSALAGIAQLGVVAWLWKGAVAGEELISRGVLAALNLLPAQWGTAALTAAGNGQFSSVLWSALGVLAAFACVGLIVILVAPRSKTAGPRGRISA